MLCSMLCSRHITKSLKLKIVFLFLLLKSYCKENTTCDQPAQSYLQGSPNGLELLNFPADDMLFGAPPAQLFYNPGMEVRFSKFNMCKFEERTGLKHFLSGGGEWFRIISFDYLQTQPGIPKIHSSTIKL